MAMQDILDAANSRVHSLRAQRNQLEQTAQDRALSDDEKRQLASVKSDLLEARDQAARLQDDHQRQAEADNARARLNLAPGGDPKPQPGLGDYNRSLGAVARGETSAATFSRNDRDLLLDDRSLGLYNLGAGGDAMDTRVLSTFWDKLESASRLFAAANLVETGPDESPLVLPTLEASGEGDAELPEHGAITEGDPATGSVNFFAHRYTTIVNASNTWVNSAAVDAQQLIAKSLAKTLVKKYRARLTVGTGVNQPQGITVGAGAGPTAASPTAIDPGELFDLVHSIEPEYRDSKVSSWVMHDSTWQQIRELTDSQGRYLVGDLANGADMRLLGYPVVVDQSMPVAATGQRAIVFGAIEEAFWIRHTHVRIDVSDSYRFQNDELSWRAIIALDSKVVDDTAIKALTMG